jgi:hypothetical protein
VLIFSSVLFNASSVYALKFENHRALALLLEFGAKVPHYIWKSPSPPSTFFAPIFFAPEIAIMSRRTAKKMSHLLNFPPQATSAVHCKNAVMTFLLSFQKLQKDVAKKIGEMVWDTRAEKLWYMGQTASKPKGVSKKIKK